MSEVLADYRPKEGAPPREQEGGAEGAEALVENDGNGLFVMANFNFRWTNYLHVLQPASDQLKLSRKLVPMDTLLKTVHAAESTRKTKSTIVDGNFTTHNLCVMRLL